MPKSAASEDSDRSQTTGDYPVGTMIDSSQLESSEQNFEFQEVGQIDVQGLLTDIQVKQKDV